MSERRFYICEEGIFRKWITEAELKRRLAFAYGAFSRSEDVEPRYTLDEAIDILLYGTEKEGPATPELPADCEPPEVLKPHKQASEQEWEEWAFSVADAITADRCLFDIKQALLAIPCHKRRKE